jgi:hypothetical protein
LSQSFTRVQAIVLDRFVAHHPGVVARRDVHERHGPDLKLGAVLEHDTESSSNENTEVADLAPLSLHERTDVRRPPPARALRIV